MDTYVINCLGHLAEIISLDENIMQFFSTLPGVTYQYARYTDWIQPFLTSSMNKAASGISSSFSKEELVKIMSKFEVFEGYLHEKDK